LVGNIKGQAMNAAMVLSTSPPVSPSPCEVSKERGKRYERGWRPYPLYTPLLGVGGIYLGD